MKINIETPENEDIVTNYIGLAQCDNGYIWLVLEHGAVCIAHSSDKNRDNDPPLLYNLSEWHTAIKNQGPFTTYRGKVTISND